MKMLGQSCNHLIGEHNERLISLEDSAFLLKWPDWGFPVNLVAHTIYVDTDCGYPSYCLAKRESFQWYQHCGCREFDWSGRFIWLSQWMFRQFRINTVPVHWLQCWRRLVCRARQQYCNSQRTYKLWSLVSCSMYLPSYLPANAMLLNDITYTIDHSSCIHTCT